MASDEAKAIQQALAEPFPPADVKWLPKNVKGNRALAMPYIDAAAVMRRLDDVLGFDGWSESYRQLSDGCVCCTLTVIVGGAVVTKEDVGTPSAQPDAGDRMKAAFSDALKRVAVKLGVGRYLRAIGHVWADYDPQKKQFSKPPVLPAWAVPDAYKPAGVAVADAFSKLAVQFCKDSRKDVAAYTADLMKALKYDPAGAVPAMQLRHVQAMQRKLMADMQEWVSGDLPANYPKTGTELYERIVQHDAELAKAKLCAVGELLAEVVAEGVRAGHGADLKAWAGNAAMRLGVDAGTRAVNKIKGRAKGGKPAETPPAAQPAAKTPAPTDNGTDEPEFVDPDDAGAEHQYTGYTDDGIPY